MALGHETVGRAYVKILADGSGLDESIKREIRESDDGVRAEGKRQGGAYASEFKKGMSHEDIGKGLRNNLERSLARTKMADRFFDSPEWRDFQDRLVHEFGDAGIIAGHELQTEFRHNVNSGFKQATIDIGDRMDDIRDKMEKPAKDFERKWRAEFDKIGEDIDRFRDHAGQGFADAGRAIQSTAGHLKELGDDIHDSTAHMEDWARRFKGTEPILGRFQSRLDRVADGIGRAFGRGSRNDFLHFIGNMARGLTRIFTTLIPKMINLLAAPFQEAKKVFDDLRAAGTSMGQSLVKAGGAFMVSLLELPATLLTLAAAAAFAAVAIGPLVGLMSLLLGTVIALTASISFGLAGALAPLVGLLGPISVAGFAVAAAFIGMDNKAKKLMKEAIEPLKEDLKELGDAARPGILRGLQTAAQNLHRPVQQLQPLFAAAGDGVATFMGAFTDAMTGPGFTQFVNVMTRQLPTEMESLGNILGHVFDGFTGALASLNRKGGPVEEFLGWLSGITEQFDEWTSGKKVAPEIDLAGGIKRPSAAPQTGFEGWMAKIEESAKALKGVLDPLWDIIGQLLSAGKPTGDSLLTSLGDTLQDLADWMTEHPDDVEQWMSDAEDFAKALGDLVVAFVDFADALDTPGGRRAAIFLIKMAEFSFGSAAGGLLLFAGAMNVLGSVNWDNIGNGLEKVWKGIDKLRNLDIPDIKLPKGFGIDWSDVINLPSAGRNLIQTAVVKAFNGLAGKAKNAMGKLDLSDIVSGAGGLFNTVTGPFKGLAKSALLRMGTFGISDIVTGLGGIAKEIYNAFPSAQQILDSIGSFDIMDVVDGLADVAANIFGAFPSAQEILASIGHIDLGSLMHGSIDPPGPLGTWTWASGGIVPFPQHGLIGEAGPEAVVPLSRPLHMVDPAVRMLSAIAQGIAVPQAATGKTIDASGWTIVSPNDAKTVASEMVNRLVAVGY